MTRCLNCGAAGQDGKFCEECGKPHLGGMSAGRATYKMYAVAVALVVLAGVGMFSYWSLLSGSAESGGAITTSGANLQPTGSGGAEGASGTTGSQNVGPSATVNGGNARTLTVSIQKMTCGSCANRIKTTVGGLTGVKSAVVSLGDKSGVVVYDPSAVTKQKIIDTISGLGYPASEISDIAGSQSAPSGSQGAAGTATGSAGGTCGGSSGTCGSSGGGCGCGCGD